MANDDEDFCVGEFVDGVWCTCGCSCEGCAAWEYEQEEG